MTYQILGCFSLRTSIDAEKLNNVSHCWQNNTNEKSLNFSKSYSMSSYLRDHINSSHLFWDPIVLGLSNSFPFHYLVNCLSFLSFCQISSSLQPYQIPPGK